jgi:autotransporter-associated beta strand protein
LNPIGNYIVITNGGKVYTTLTESTIGYAYGSVSNSVVVSGAGSLWDIGGGDIAFCKAYVATTNNTLTVANGGTVADVRYLTLYGTSSQVIFNGGNLIYGAGAGAAGAGITTNALAVTPQVIIQSGGAVVDTYTNVLSSLVPFTEDPSSTGGGLTKLGTGTLTLADLNTYTGPTTVSNGILESVTPTTYATNTVVYLYTASGALNLNFTGTNIVTGLYINGVQQAAGVYGSSTLPITGTGYLQVLTGATVTAQPKLNYSLSGSAGSQTLGFNWTGSFKLQSQTNALSVGLSNNWGDYPGGASSPVTVPINVTNGAVFFRLAPLP